MTWWTPARRRASCATWCRARISPPSMPSRSAARWWTPSSPRCHRTRGSTFPGTRRSRSSRRSARPACNEPRARRRVQSLEGEAMAKPTDTFDPEAPDPESVEEFDRLLAAFQDHVDNFVQERELSFGVVSLLAAQMCLTMRMFDYVASAEAPSVDGLQGELDRFHDEVSQAVEGAKAGAAEFLEAASEALAEAAAQLDADEKSR